VYQIKTEGKLARSSVNLAGYYKLCNISL